MVECRYSVRYKRKKGANGTYKRSHILEATYLMWTFNCSDVSLVESFVNPDMSAKRIVPTTKRTNGEFSPATL